VIPPKTIIGTSVFLLALSAALGLLNTQKARGLRARVTHAEVARNEAEQLRITREKELQGREAAVAAAEARFSEARTQVASTEAELIKAQNGKSELQAKLRENEAATVQLLKRIEEAEGKPIVRANPSIANLQAQLEDAKKQLDAAEREKALLSDKIRASQERSTQLESEQKRQLPAGGSPGIRGTVLAVNQAYNFVVLNLGGRQGVELNSEMLVLRGVFPHWENTNFVG
jgi:chromosome segregation ATPase